MNDIVDPPHQADARAFRALIAAYEANRDLVLMGAYRAGADPQLDRAIAMHGALTAFLGQSQREVVPMERSIAELHALMAA
jgi:flagellum-specific ATP synthase